MRGKGSRDFLHRKPGRLEIRAGICLAAMAALFFTGCGVQPLPSDLENEAVTLLDPLEEVENFEAAAYRNLYNADVYTGSVLPDIVEYSFPAGNVTFERFTVMLGDSVRKGEVLAYAYTEELDERIKDMEEQIRDMEKQQQEYIKDTEEQLREPENEALNLKIIVENLEEAEPEKYDHESSKAEKNDPEKNNSDKYEPEKNESADKSVSGGDAEVEGEPALTEEYIKWQKLYNEYNGRYSILAHQNDTVRLQMEQRTQLYELDHANMQKQLERLKEEWRQYRITSSINGEVVAMKFGEEVDSDAEIANSLTAPASFLSIYDDVLKDDAVIAVGDMDHKLIRCPYITSSALAVAQEVYAFIDGERYEVKYVKTNTDSYSTFEFLEDVKVPVGINAYIVVVNWAREHVLTVPQDAVSGEQGGYYVTLKQGEETVTAPVTIGRSDGVYQEILSGLSERDEVAVEAVTSAGGNRAVLASGSPGAVVDYGALLFYPTSFWVENPVTNGTTYFVESMVERYQQIEAGDVLAAIRVEKDKIVIQEYETKLRRLQERLADLIKDGEEKNKKAIERQREAIADLEEEIADLNKDYGTTKIVAPKAGMVYYPPFYPEGSVLYPNAYVALMVDTTGDDFYLVIPDAGSAFRYGEEDVAVSYIGSDRLKHETYAEIVSLPYGYLSDSLASSYALATIPREAAEDMLALDSMLSRYRGTVTLSISVQPIKNVLLVPSSAVKTTSGQTYVYVVEENGEIIARSFIAAGSGYGYYWVIDGLTEGMEICL